MRHDEALILMGKSPIPGAVKTRLCPPLVPREAAALYACLLEDIAEETNNLRGVRRYLFYSPPEGKGYFLGDPFAGFLLREQGRGSLGMRMERAARAAFSEGARRVVVIGADCPALSAGRIRLAFRELSNAAGAVFGPADDGGFYLVGIDGPAPFLFRGIEWGTSAVLATSLSRCRDAGTPFALLPRESDLDTAEDLLSLRRRVRGRGLPACPRTRKWLESALPALISSRGRSSFRRPAG